jgi:DNA-binding IclR family transcriptional regulator
LATRFSIATTVHHHSGEAVAAITLVGSTSDVQPRAKKLSRVLLRHVDAWSIRLMSPREPI